MKFAESASVFHYDDSKTANPSTDENENANENKSETTEKQGWYEYLSATSFWTDMTSQIGQKLSSDPTLSEDSKQEFEYVDPADEKDLLAYLTRKFKNEFHEDPVTAKKNAFKPELKLDESSPDEKYYDYYKQREF